MLRPAILWNDQRTGEECAEIEDLIGVERLDRADGQPRARGVHGAEAPLAAPPRARRSFERIARVCLPKDYVRLRLTGEWATDVADASGTLLLDVAARRWSEEVLAALDIPPEWLPPVRESPEVAGAGDCAAAALGVGVTAPGPLSIVLGTSGVVFAVLPEYRPEPAGRLHTFCHAVPGAWHAMGVMLAAAGSLQWFRDRLAPEASFDDLVAEAGGWNAGADGLFFLPYLAGERTPHADPNARGAFVGLSLHHDRGALVRAVLEGVAFGLRDSLELLRGLGVEASHARVSGGG